MCVLVGFVYPLQMVYRQLGDQHKRTVCTGMLTDLSFRMRFTMATIVDVCVLEGISSSDKATQPWKSKWSRASR